MSDKERNAFAPLAGFSTIDDSHLFSLPVSLCLIWEKGSLPQKHQA